MANKMIEYADWAISDFLKRAASHQWFDSTLFVFVGDHGQIRYFNAYDMPLTYNQVPLYIYAPKILKSNKIVNTFGSQCDIFPTVMSLLGIPFVNNTPGVNLLAKKKQCTLFTTEYKIGCIDSTYFYVYRENGPSSLYKYRTNSTIDYIDSLPSVADSLRLYALSILQASQLNIKNNKTGSDHCH
jgi:phosphoglycerol transferase MdoB-like AlkP superfamily enzyme